LKQSSLVLSLIVASAFALSPASADDYSPFNGVYVGVHGGYSWQDTSGVFDNQGDATNLSGISLDSPLIGGQLGYNYMMNSFVVGIEADASAAVGSSDTIVNDPTLAAYEQLTAEIGYLASVRGRLGFVVSDVMFYATGGIGFGEFKFTENAPAVPYLGTMRFKERGAVYGGGIEWNLMQGVSLRGEYLHYDLGGTHLLPTSLPDVDPGDSIKFHDIDVVRAAINVSLNP
jgi:outer membrane immunogenic protein